MKYILNENGSASLVQSNKKKKKEETPAMVAVNNQPKVNPVKTMIDNSAIKNNGFTISNAITDAANYYDAVNNMYNQMPVIGTLNKARNKALKTIENTATNMGTDALKAVEGAADTASDIYFNPQERAINYAYDFVTKGKKTADENLKDLKEMQQRDIKKNMTQEILDKTGYSDIVDDLEKDSLVKRDNLAGQVAQGVGGMVPALVLGQAFGATPELTNLKGLAGKERLAAALSNVGKTYAAQLPSNLMLGAQSYGGGIEEALNDGANMNQARLYGLANAAIEQGTEMLTGGVPGLGGKGGIDNYVEPLINRNTNGYLNALLKYGYKGLGEGLEEYTGTMLEPLAKKIYSDEKIDWNQVRKDARRAGVIGAGTGLLLDAPSVTQDVKNVRSENKIRNAIGDVEYAEGSPQYNPDYKGWENQRNENRIENEKRIEENAKRREEFEKVQQQRQEETRKAQELAQERQKEQEQLKQQEKTQKDNDYNKYYKRANLENFDSNVVNKAKEVIASNKQGKRTKQEWLDVADNIGMQLRGQDAETIKKYAYESFKAERPNVKDNLNRQGQKYVSFKVDEWVDAVQKAAQSQSSPEVVQSSVETEQQTPQVNNKQMQFDIISNTNPMQDEYHTGIRSEDDIKTFEEAINDEESFVWGDYSKEDAQRDLEKGTVTVYSSKPIEQGAFVSTSQNQARDYAGGNKIYSQEVPIEDVAWINGDEGQYAKVENNNIPAVMEKEPVIKAKSQNDVKNTKTANTSEMQQIRNEVEEKTGKTMSKHIETSSKATGTVKDIKNMDYDTIVYDSTTNKQSREKALRELSGNDTDTNVNDIHAKFRGTERLTDVDSAKITELMKQTKSLADEAAKIGNDAEYNKRMEQFRTLKGDYAVALSESGQFIQYAKVINELDPETQIDVLNKVIEREQRRGNKKYEGVKLNEELVEEYKNAKTDEARDAILEEIKDDTARQIKITFADKANEFRFLSMLGNVKTHGRNIVGNLGMYSLQSFKDGVAAIGEDLYNKVSKGGLETRTKTLKPATKEVSQFVNDKVDSFMKDQTNKYNESRGVKGDLEGRTKKFSENNVIGRALNKASDINSKALDFEDKYFTSKMTKQAMKGFLTANGIETNADIEAHPELVAQALDYAIFKGKEATFHQDSTTATAIRNLRDKLYTGSGYSQLGGLAIDATLPFVSTPANIAKTALEYTPIIGFGDINTQLQQAPNNMKANVFIDSISKQFSGAALMAVGAFLASKGLVKGAGDGDKEDKTEASLGNASYSIKLGDSTYDLSWLAPTAIPFFEGVEAFNALKKAKSKDGLKATDVADLVDTMFGTLNPMTDMSVLQSIERIITSIAYGGNAVKSAASTTFSSYLQQYFPTLLSQIAQIGDTKQRNTNTGNNVVEKTIDQIKYKIPGLRNTLPEKVDVWGETNKTASNIPQRAFEALLSPANRKDYKVDDTTKELERLAEETDDTAMLPTAKGKTVKVNGENYNLKGNDYVNLQKTYGKTAKENLDKLTASQTYKNASDLEKRSMVRNLYDYASYKAKEEYAKNNGIDFDSGNQTSYAMIDAFNIPYEKYVENKVSGNESASKMLDKLNKMGLNEAQKGAVMNYYNRAYYVNENELYNTLKNSNLSDKQKELVKAKYEKNITDAERERYKRADAIGVDYDVYTKFRNFVSGVKGDSKTGGLTKNQKIINWIESQKLTAKQKQNLYNDYKNNQGIMSYYK